MSQWGILRRSFLLCGFRNNLNTNLSQMNHELFIKLMENSCPINAIYVENKSLPFLFYWFFVRIIKIIPIFVPIKTNSYD